MTLYPLLLTSVVLVFDALQFLPHPSSLIRLSHELSVKYLKVCGTPAIPAGGFNLEDLSLSVVEELLGCREVPPTLRVEVRQSLSFCLEPLQDGEFHASGLGRFSCLSIRLELGGKGLQVQMGRHQFSALFQCCLLPDVIRIGVGFSHGSCCYKNTWREIVQESRVASNFEIFVLGYRGLKLKVNSQLAFADALRHGETIPHTYQIKWKRRETINQNFKMNFSKTRLILRITTKHSKQNVPVTLCDVINMQMSVAESARFSNPSRRLSECARFHAVWLCILLFPGGFREIFPESAPSAGMRLAN